MSSSRGRVPDLLVEKLALGELSQVEAAKVRARLVVAGELDRLSAMGESDVGPMPEVIRERILRERARERARRRGRSRSWSLLVTAASFAVMALVVAVPARDTTRAKGGGAALVIYRAGVDGHAPEVLAEGAIARRGDVLQLALRAEGARQAAVYSIDGRGLITEHMPPRDVGRKTELRLDDGCELDDAPRFERFVLLLGDTLDGRAIRAALAKLALADDPATAPLVVPGARVVSRVLTKGGP